MNMFSGIKFAVNFYLCESSAARRIGRRRRRRNSYLMLTPFDLKGTMYFWTQAEAWDCWEREESISLGIPTITSMLELARALRTEVLWSNSLTLEMPLELRSFTEMEGERGWEDCMPQFTPRDRTREEGRKKEKNSAGRVIRFRFRHGWAREVIWSEGFRKKKKKKKKKWYCSLLQLRPAYETLVGICSKWSR